MLPANEAKKMTLLLVDDEPDLVDLFSEYLSHLQLNILKASNGAEALEKAQQVQVDVILTDLKMPVMGGLDLIRSLRQMGFWNPVVILTGQGEKKAVVEALRLGVFEFLDKPIEEEHLLREIGKVIEFARKVNEIIAEAPPSLRQSLYYMELLKVRTGT